MTPEARTDEAGSMARHPSGNRPWRCLVKLAPKGQIQGPDLAQRGLPCSASLRDKPARRSPRVVEDKRDPARQRPCDSITKYQTDFQHEMMLTPVRLDKPLALCVWFGTRRRDVPNPNDA